MKYIVISKFRDLQGNDRVYEVGEAYAGKKTKERIAELTTDNNKIGIPVIEAVEEEKKQVKTE